MLALMVGVEWPMVFWDVAQVSAGFAGQAGVGVS